MSMLVRWLDEDRTIVHYRLEDRWTWDEFKKAHDEIMEMMRSVDHPVSLVIEFADLWSTLFPSGVVLGFSSLLDDFPPNHKSAIIVTKASIVHQTLSEIKQTSFTKAAKNMQIVSSLDSAYNLLGFSSDVLVS